MQDGSPGLVARFHLPTRHNPASRQLFTREEIHNVVPSGPLPALFVSATLGVCGRMTPRAAVALFGHLRRSGQFDPRFDEFWRFVINFKSNKIAVDVRGVNLEGQWARMHRIPLFPRNPLQNLPPVAAHGWRETTPETRRKTSSVASEESEPRRIRPVNK